MEALLQIIASSGFGSIVGGLFGWLNRKEDAKMEIQRLSNQRSMVSLQSKAESAKYDSMAFMESQKTLSKFGDAVKSFVRPLITGVLLYMCYRIFISLESLTGGLEALETAELYQLYRDIVLNIISLTATSVSWWFAARPSGAVKR